MVKNLDNLNINNVKEAGDKDYNLITFSWNLIDICQYRCSYCSAMNFNLNTFKKKPHFIKAWKNTIKFLKLMVKTPYAIEILGGEPTLHPDIENIISEAVKDKYCIQVDLITNLAKPYDFYKKLDVKENSKLTIEASHHPEYCGNKYIQKVIDLNNNLEYISIFSNINLPDDQKHWKQTKDLIDKFKKNNVFISLNFLQSVGTGPVGGWDPNYTNDFWKYFHDYINPVEQEKLNYGKGVGIKNATLYLNEHANEITTNIKYIDDEERQYILSEADINKYKLNRFKGWSCKSLMYTINMDGTIKNSCTNEVVPITKLNKKHLTKCVKCPLTQCSCDTMFLFYKTNPKYDKID